MTLIDTIVPVGTALSFIAIIGLIIGLIINKISTKEIAKIKLKQEAWDHFVNMLEAPKKASPKLKRVMRDYSVTAYPDLLHNESYLLDLKGKTVEIVTGTDTDKNGKTTVIIGGYDKSQNKLYILNTFEVKE